MPSSCSGAPSIGQKSFEVQRQEVKTHPATHSHHSLKSMLLHCFGRAVFLLYVCVVPCLCTHIYIYTHTYLYMHIVFFIAHIYIYIC